MSGKGLVLRLALATTLLGITPATAQSPAPPVLGPSVSGNLPASPQPSGLPDATPPVPGPSVPVPRPSMDLAPRVAPPPRDCTVEGTDGPDHLTGTVGPDVICGEGGDDILEGLEGDDMLDGGEGSDTATWETSLCCVRANLATGMATGGLGADQLDGIENLGGSQGTDLLRGSAGANAISGNGGIDLLFGGDGDDWLVGGDGDDWLAGEGGTNILDGGTGANVCADGAGTFCVDRNPADPSDTRGILDIGLVHASLDQEPLSWQIAVRKGAGVTRLWDEGYVVVSLDTQGGDEFDSHALMRFTKRGPMGLLIPQGKARATGRVEVKRIGGRAFLVELPLGRLGLDPLRLYYRWSVTTIYTGNGCKPCIDAVPDARAYPQPLI